MDKRYKDLHVIDKNGNIILTRRAVTKIRIFDNMIVYTFEKNVNNLVTQQTDFEILLPDTTGLKVVID